MERINRLSRLEKSGVVAVIRGDSPEGALKTSEAVIAGGVKGIELTFTVPYADQVIKDLVKKYKADKDVVIGAGTVLDAITARLAIMAGAEFIVSPTFDKETAELCNLYQIPYLPGCMTITEMKVALKAGVDVVKLFPGSAFGPSVIKAFKAPLPHLNIMPTGGVSVENMEEWFGAGAVVVGAGGNLTAPALKGDYKGVTLMASEYRKKYMEIKGRI